MIKLAYIYRQGVRQQQSVTFAVDPFKIASYRVKGGVVEIEYAETYDRRRQPIMYRLNVSKASFEANLAEGLANTDEFLTLTIIGSNTDRYKPHEVDDYTLNLMKKYIVDIRESAIMINGVKTACRRVEYVPASFVPVILYVSNSLNSMVVEYDEPTTTTDEPTTTTDEPTTTTDEPTTTTDEPTTTTDELTTTTSGQV